MKVYEIKEEIFALQEMEAEEVNPETGEVTDNTEVLKELLDSLKIDESEKADGIAYLIQREKDNEKALQAEISRLQTRKKSTVNEQKKLLNLLDYLLAGEKLKTLKHTFYYQASKSLSIIDEGKVPSEFIAFEPKIDKTGLKKAVISGTVAPSIAVISTNIGLRIK